MNINDRIQNNIGLVYKVIDKFNLKDHAKDDFIQVGLIGLWKALEVYDEKLGRLTPFCYRKIRWEILRAINKMEKARTFQQLNDNDSKVDSKEEIWDVLPNNLDSTEKTIVDMRIDGCSFKEIGQTINLTYYYVRKNFKAAIKKLKEANTI